MKVLIAAVLFALSAGSYAVQFNKYDAAAVKRFDDELRRLGVVLPSLTKSDEAINPPDPIVSSAAGDFEGYWTKSQFGRPIAAFEGIPYAQPPVGLLRFRIAHPLTSKLSNFKAKKPGSKCVQRHILFKTLDVEGNEDCLFLNVYVPEKIQRAPSEQLPVIFFVHGGAYITGQGDLYQSNILLDQDVVLVTFNYRLGPLGFLTTEDEVIPGNIGLKDQVAALRWVHKNIAAFGGNPNLITVFGHSAGSACTEFLMLSPLTKGLFHRIIAVSGSSLAPWAVAPPGEMRHNVQKAAQVLRCPLEHSDDLLTCLQTKTAEEITTVDAHFRLWGNTLALPFKPIVEGDIPGAVLPQHPKKLFADTPNSDVPCMMSVCSDEGSFFSVDIFMNDTTLREFDENFVAYAAQSLQLTDKSPEIIESLRRAYFSPGPLDKSKMFEGSNLFTDVYFVWPVVKSELSRRKHAKSSTYFRYLSYVGTRSFLNLYGYPSVGVSHGDDMFYLFALPGETQPSPQDVLMSMILTDLVASFALDGVPSSKLLKTKWLPVTTEGTDIEYLHVESPLNIFMKKDFLPERWNLLDKLLGDNQNQRRQDEL